MMKHLLITILCLFYIIAQAQTYPGGLDSINLAGHPCLIKVPSGTGPWPLAIEWGPQTVYADQAPGGLQNLAGFGHIKQIYNGKNPYFLKHNGDSGKYIIIAPQPSSYNDFGFADDVLAFWNAYKASSYWNITDTSKDANNMYEWIAFFACERGAATIFNTLTWTASTGWGSTPPTFFNQIKKIYVAGVYYSVYNVDNLTSASYNTSGHRIVKFYNNQNNFFIDARMYDSLVKFSPSGYFKLKIMPASPTVTDQMLYDSLFSVIPLDSVHSPTRAFLDDPGTAPTLYQIQPFKVYDLAGYEKRDAGKPQHLFDSTGGSTFVDPLNDITDFNCPSCLLSAWPYKQFGDYWSPWGVGSSKGVRLLIDLTGSKNRRDTTNRIIVNSIYAACTPGTSGNDTMAVYAADTMLTVPKDQLWQFLADPTKMVLMGYMVSQSGSTPTWQFINFNNRKCRYIMLVEHLQTHVSGMTTYYTNAPYAKMVVYGTYDTTTYTHIPTHYTKKLYKKRQTYAKFRGVNEPQGNNYNTIKRNGNVRIYGSIQQYDTSHWTQHMPYKYDQYLDIGPTQYDTMKRNGINFWWSIRGNRHLVDSLATLAGVGGYQAGTDSFPQETEDWHSYKLRAQLWFNLIAVHGSVAISTSLTHWGTGITNGKNDWYSLEDGNEEDGHLVTPLAQWMRMNCDYDGYEGRLGANYGGKAADPNFPLMMGGTTAMDTLLVQAYALFSGLMRDDGRLPFDIINFHSYPRTGDERHRDPDAEEQVGMHGASAEQYQKISVYKADSAGVDAYLNTVDGDTSYIILCTETGYGNWGTPATSPSQAGYWDISCTPSVGSRDSLTEKAWKMGRLEFQMWGARVHGYTEFYFSNSDYGPNTFNLFQDNGQTTGRDAVNFTYVTPFPTLFYQGCMYDQFKNYYLDSVLTEGDTTGVWTYLLRNINHSDSLCYVRYLGSDNGSTLTSQPFNLGNLSSNAVNEVIMSSTSFTPTVTGLTASGNSVTRDINEGIKAYFVQGTAGNIAPVANAGPDQTITLPSFTVLDGTASYDPDGTIVSYQWTKISGGHAIIVSPFSAKTPIVALAAGTYTFRLTVTDNSGATGTDDVVITVLNRTYSNFLNR